ncbi:unnamed protein product [Amoebophrya sp. A25]|nr:unnamed protein product [Amoebophrya sp. A25]|eukprot:GSA25T00008597001.1
MKQEVQKYHVEFEAAGVLGDKSGRYHIFQAAEEDDDDLALNLTRMKLGPHQEEPEPPSAKIKKQDENKILLKLDNLLGMPVYPTNQDHRGDAVVKLADLKKVELNGKLGIVRAEDKSDISRANGRVPVVIDGTDEKPKGLKPENLMVVGFVFKAEPITTEPSLDKHDEDHVEIGMKGQVLTGETPHLDKQVASVGWRLFCSCCRRSPAEHKED